MASTTLLGTYLAALRPQPTYASPLGSLDHQSPANGRLPGHAAVGAVAVATCAQADVTVGDDTGLRNAILASHDDSVICIDGTITLGSDLPTLDDTTVTFVGDDSTTDIINGNSRSIFVSDDTAALDDTVTVAQLGVRDGYHPYGGAIFVYGGNLVLADSMLSGNGAHYGGAVAVYGGTADISGTVLEDSLADQGTLFVSATSTTISNSTISGNTALKGAGVLARGGTLTATAISVTGNSNTYAGSAVYLQYNDLRLQNSFIGGNTTAIDGGGVTAYLSNVDLVFSTVYGNTSGGGAVFQVGVVAGDLLAYGSFVGNSADDTALFLSGGATVDDTYSVSTGPGPSFTGQGSRHLAGGTLQLGTLDDTLAPGHGGRTPAPSSPLVRFAPSSDLGTGIRVDQVGNARPGGGTTWTIGSRQVAFSPTPAPLTPPSAPRNVQAEPRSESALVSWDPPADAGSFPVTNYHVIAYPGGRSCLAPVSSSSCLVRGLTNGQAYTFTVEALNGAGWGQASTPTKPVTPESPNVVLILDQGVRASDGMHDRITTSGSSRNVPAGTRLTPFIKYSGQESYLRGQATIVVQSDGTFDWTRQIKKNRGLRAYVAWEDVESNRVFWVRVR